MTRQTESLRLSKMADGQPEIFRSLQGEGIRLGVPSVFVRLAFCNLSCTWCDTKYTWDWKTYAQNDYVVSWPIPKVVSRIKGLNCQNLVITGGEPMLQQRQLGGLLAELNGMTIEVETNGTVTPNREMCEKVSNWNVSPKLHNGGDTESKRLVDEPLRSYAQMENACFKFVIQQRTDLDEVDELLPRHGIRPSAVLLMPEGLTSEVIQERSLWLIDECRLRGFRYTPRLHILLAGNRRGF